MNQRKWRPTEAGIGKGGIPTEAATGKDGIPTEVGTGKDGFSPRLSGRSVALQT